MGFSDWLASRRDEIKTAASRITDKGTMEAVVYVTCRVAYADGTCDQSEKDQGLNTVTAFLPAFKAKDIAKAWDDAEKIVKLGPTMSAQLDDEIVKRCKTPDTAKLVARTGCAVGAADGDFDQDEQGIMRAICERLRLDPTEFGM